MRVEYINNSLVCRVPGTAGAVRVKPSAPVSFTSSWGVKSPAPCSLHLISLKSSWCATLRSYKIFEHFRFIKVFAAMQISTQMSIAGG